MPKAPASPSQAPGTDRSRVLILAVLLIAIPVMASGDDEKTVAPGGCTAGSVALAGMQAAALPGTGADQTPADVVIEDGYRFIVLGSTGVRFWPDNSAKFDSLMRSGDRAEAACKIKAPNGTSWLALRSAGGSLRYIPATATASAQDYDAELSRMHALWDKQANRGATMPATPQTVP